MNITELELRAMVREAIARQAAAGGHAVAPPAPAPSSAPSLSSSTVLTPHPSHGRLALVGGGDAEGRCVIEPAVACTHCGYCQSMGH